MAYSSTYLPSHIQSLFFTVSMARTNSNVYSDLHIHSLPFYGFYHLMFPFHPLPTPLFICLLKTHQHIKLGQPNLQSRHHPNPRNTCDATVNIFILKKSFRLNKIWLSDSSKKCFLETFISNGLLENGKLQLKDKHPHGCGFCGSFFPIYTRIHFYHFLHLFKYLPLK